MASVLKRGNQLIKLTNNPSILYSKTKVRKEGRK